MSICDYCYIERCTEGKQCTVDLFKKGIIFRHGELLIIGNISEEKAKEELEKPFLEAKS